MKAAKIAARAKMEKISTLLLITYCPCKRKFLTMILLGEDKAEVKVNQ